MKEVILTLIAFLLVFIPIIGIHEFGHLIVARLLGIKVIRFSLGFGKTLFRWQGKSGIEYRIGAVPLGGYVKMLDEREGEVPASQLKYAFDHQAIWKRILIILAGPMANLLLAILAFSLMFIIGIKTFVPVIGQVAADSPAEYAGIKAGEEIVAVDGRETPNWMKVAIAVSSRIGEKDSMKVSIKELSGRHETKNIQLKNWQLDPLKPEPLRDLGIMPLSAEELPQHEQLERYSLTQSVKHAFSNTGLFLRFHLIIIAKLTTGKMSLTSLGGPIAIVRVAYLTFQQGIANFLNFIAILSITIATINLLPIPGLDGGQMLYLAIEGIRRKPVSLALQVLIFRLAMIAFVLLLIKVLLNDLLRLIG